MCFLLLWEIKEVRGKHRRERPDPATRLQAPLCLEKVRTSVEHGGHGTSAFKRQRFGAKALKSLMQANTSFEHRRCILCLTLLPPDVHQTGWVSQPSAPRSHKAEGRVSAWGGLTAHVQQRQAPPKPASCLPKTPFRCHCSRLHSRPGAYVWLRPLL